MGKLALTIVFLYFFTFFAQNSLTNARIQGQIVSFIDVNADLFTDLVLVTPPNFISVYVAQQESVTSTSHFKQAMFKEDERFRWRKFPNGTRILNVGVGDFNGDSQPDLAVSLTLDEVTAKKSESKCEDGPGQLIYICYGAGDGAGFSQCLPVKHSGENGTGEIMIVCEQPLILDCNIDQHSDLLTTVYRDGRMQFVCFHSDEKETGSFEVMLPFADATPASSPTSNAFIDVTGDLNPEIVLWTKKKHGDELVGLQVLHLSEDKKWVRMPDDFMPAPTPFSGDAPKLLPENKSKEKPNILLGQSVYDDFNKDGLIDHMLPFCELDKNGDCTTLMFRVWIQKDKWETPVLAVPLLDANKQQWAVYNESSENAKSPTFHVRSGDYTQDGYPDLIIVLEQVTEPKSDRKRAAFLLENVGCPAGEVCKDFTRSFRITWTPFECGKDELSRAVTAAGFFDLGEDGTLDVLLEYRNATSLTYMDFSTSVFEGDTTFLKVQVFTATCVDDCRFGREGSAISMPGAALIYTSSDADGNSIRGAYTQRSISAYRPLLPPYALFGLGRTPNFVEKLTVGVPAWPMRNKSWEQIVPNSRIYVIPVPVEQPRKWVHRLYLTPNKLIMYSLISLSSVCGLIIIVVFALHMQERRMDKKERELQRERFHFDAM